MYALLPVAWLFACAGGDDADAAGEPPTGTDPMADPANLPYGAGTAPHGGAPWDPRLAGCTWTETVDVDGNGPDANGHDVAARLVYDDEGRVEAREAEVIGGRSTVESFTWDGTCVVASSGTLDDPIDGPVEFAVEQDCDEHGYARARVSTFVTPTGTAVQRDALRNAYVGGDLASITMDVGDDGVDDAYTAFTWSGGHVASAEAELPPGHWVDSSSWSYNDAGLVEMVASERVEEGEVSYQELTWAYDAAGLRVQIRTDLMHSTLTYTYEQDGDWPSSGVEVFAEDGEYVYAWTVTCG